MTERKLVNGRKIAQGEADSTISAAAALVLLSKHQISFQVKSETNVFGIRSIIHVLVDVPLMNSSTQISPICPFPVSQ